ncbi:CLUMA_CG002043, isoform A [Clunio marinus]|uniref:CLUMA_CG002043, isoform A n=1 Tax=Clunio marinus TaxID=568069 RepID=A0A1J1HJP7_9DIPT|nr:CLUMA_CG002043, isoform A [Clunio marinus]
MNIDYLLTNTSITRILINSFLVPVFTTNSVMWNSDIASMSKLSLENIHQRYICNNKQGRMRINETPFFIRSSSHFESVRITAKSGLLSYYDRAEWITGNVSEVFHVISTYMSFCFSEFVFIPNPVAENSPKRNVKCFSHPHATKL